MIGVDEVGRGCWAGPLLVVAARQIGDLPKGLDDSKKLSKKKRTTFFYDIELTCDTGEGWVSAEEVDALGLTKAMYVAVERALTGVGAAVDEEIIMDGNINYCPPKYLRSSAVIDADASHPTVSAASIYAKVLRDAHMAEQAKLHPGYAFEKHVGYGTAAHSAALKQLGLCVLHRKSFKPVRAYV